MGRTLINPKQELEDKVEPYTIGKNTYSVTFNKNTGYTFSDDSSMDEVYKLFLKKGFKPIKLKIQK